MITETIQEIIKYVQKLLCWHDFKVVFRKDNGTDFWICRKCEYIKFFL